MSHPLRLAIIGCGAIGDEHAKCLTTLPDASLQAYCDREESRATRFLHAYGGNYATSDPDRVFADDAVDAVYICTRTNTHSALAIAAAKAGKHVMMEKPLALTEKGCFSVAEAVERSGITFMTAFKLRYSSTVHAAREFLPKPTILAGQMMDVRWPDDFWGNDPVQGGGNVLSQGCHSVDLLCCLANAEPVRVYAEGGNFHHPTLDIIDSLVATIQFDNGAVATLVQGDSGHTPLTSKFSFQMMDGDRTVHLHNRLKTALLWDGTQATEVNSETEDGLYEENRAFLHAVSDHTPPPTGVREGVRATMVLRKAFEAMSTHISQKIIL